MANSEPRSSVTDLLLNKMKNVVQDIDDFDSPDHSKRLETLKVLVKALSTVKYPHDDDDWV